MVWKQYHHQHHPEVSNEKKGGGFDWNSTSLIKNLEMLNLLNNINTDDALSPVKDDYYVNSDRNSPTTSETFAFDDIEKLCIQMAEHALEH